MRKLKVWFVDDGPYLFQNDTKDPLNDFYVQDGFLVILHKGLKTYFPAHRIMKAEETEEL